MATRKRKTRRRPTSRSASQQLPGWTWMLFGLAVGLAVAAAIYVNDRSPRGPLPAALPAPVQAPQSKSPPPASPEPPKEERFQFYDMLPAFEVIIPEQDLEARPDIAPAPVTAPGPYVLQAGSFSSNADADRMKAQLALLGIVSRIQKVSIDERTFHRVRVGPVNDLDELNDMRERLRDAKIDVMVIRIAE
jgi:cell division protein FtsN